MDGERAFGMRRYPFPLYESSCSCVSFVGIEGLSTGGDMREGAMVTMLEADARSMIGLTREHSDWVVR